MSAEAVWFIGAGVTSLANIGAWLWGVHKRWDQGSTGWLVAIILANVLIWPLTIVVFPWIFRQALREMTP